jgi:cholesterol transport system auxiliary component
VKDIDVKGLVQASLFMGLVSLMGGCSLTTPTSDTYALSSGPVVTGPSARGKQILVPVPGALKVLDSEQVVIHLPGSQIQYLAKARWGDRLPKLVQTKLVEAFENSGKVGGVGTPGEGLAIDYQVITDIRAFEVDTDGTNVAHVAISVKVLNDRTGAVRAQRVFSAEMPLHGSANPDYIKALDGAFSTVTADIVTFTLKSI